MLGRLFKDKSAHRSTMQFPLQGWIKKCHPSHWVTDGWLPSTPPPHFENFYGSAVKHWHWHLIPGMVLSPPWLRPRVAPPCSQLANCSLSQTSHNNYSSHFTLLIFSLAIHQESFWRRCMVDWHPFENLSWGGVRKEFLSTELEFRGFTLVMQLSMLEQCIFRFSCSELRRRGGWALEHEVWKGG